MLNDKQTRFVAEYLVLMNATQAAIGAGYSEATAYSQGQRLLKHVEVAAAIEKGMKRVADKLEITQERIVSELAKIGFADIRKAVSWRTAAIEEPAEGGTSEEMEPQAHGIALKRSRSTTVNLVELVDSAEIDDDTAAAIAEISQTDKGGLKVKLHDKRAALVDLGKHLGMFKEGINLTGNVTVEVVKFAMGDDKTRSET